MVVQTKYVEVDREELRELRDESAELARLRAQPARQVGGDERERKAGLFDQYAKEAEVAGFAGVGEWIDALQESLRLVTLARDAFDKKLTEWQQIAETEAENRMAERAALAPAAVVMPERCHSTTAQLGNIRGAIFNDGWNAALNEVARLNRNPIPVELLERIADNLESTSRHRPCTSQAHCLLTELRALLNKDEK